MASKPFLPQEIIAQKRDGKTLDQADIKRFIAGLTEGGVNDAQAGAFAMAVLLKGLNRDERVALTAAMAGSGSVLDWSAAGFDGPVIDKHSTGGVGDKVSLILAPIVAACGGYVPMISGRGLGHTGGTLDKLDSIPGYHSQPDTATLRKVVGEVGCAIIGATNDIAPADRRLYAIRDISGTVESLDLITASILSKKLAAGLDALVLDVKFGTGAFMADYGDAKALAESLVSVGNGAGMKTAALLTDMNQVLGRTAGNAVEVGESIDLLLGKSPEPRLRDVTLALSGHLLALGGLAENSDAGIDMARKALESGQAAERFAQMVVALGGPADLMEAPDKHLPAAPIVKPVFPESAGSVTAVDTRAIGIAIVTLGGGRTDPTANIDHRVGLTQVAGIGEAVDPANVPLAMLHAVSEDQFTRAAQAVRAAFTLGDAPASTPLIADEVSEK